MTSSPADLSAPAQRSGTRSSSLAKCGTVVPYLVIAVCIALAYANSLTGPFVLDDHGSILHNSSLSPLWPLRRVLTTATFATVVGRPLLNLSLAVNYALHGTAVAGYHLFNLFAHAGVAWLLYALLQGTWELPRCRISASPRVRTGLALAAAILWGVHPLTTAAVTYIVQRGEVLMAGWYLATLLCLLRGATGEHPRRWSLLAILCCLGGVGTKEVIATAPLVALLYDALCISGSLRAAWQARWKLYLGLASTWIALGVLMYSSGGRSQTAGIGYGMSPLDYALSQFGFIVHYLKLVIWPAPLIFDYGDPLTTAWPRIVLPAAFLLGWLALVGYVGRQWPGIGFLGCVPFLVLAPTSSIVPLVTQTAAEHRMYLPLAACITLLVLAGWHVTGRLTRSKLGWREPLAVSVAVAVAVSFGLLTQARNRDYSSELNLWRDTTRKAPWNARAFNNLGQQLLERGDYQEARQAFGMALQLSPGNAATWYNQAVACRQLRLSSEALESIQHALKLRSDHAPSYWERGVAYGQLQQPEAELADYTRAIQLDPHFGRAYLSRSITRFERGDAPGAWADLLAAERLQLKAPPGYREALQERVRPR